MSTLSKLAMSFVGHLKPDRIKTRAIGPTIQLPAPDTTGGIPVMQAIALRHSERRFSSADLSPQEMSNLLWAAFGVNRPAERGRTAPSALDAQEIDIYVVTRSGLYYYEPFGHTLLLVSEVDARKVTGFQDFVDTAPVDLVYVANSPHLGILGEDERRPYSAFSAGAIAQNVYLYCASAGLATVVRGWFDREALTRALGLVPEERIVLTQTVGRTGGRRSPP